MIIVERTKRAFKAALSEFKGAPVFPRGTGFSSIFGGRYTMFGGSNIDYAGDTGPLWNSSLVMAVVNFVATLLTEAPPMVVTLDEKGIAQPVPDHPLTNLLNNPNPHDTGDAVMMAFALDWFIFGNVFWLKEREPRYNQVIRLWPLPAFLVRPRWDTAVRTSFIDSYRYHVGGSFQDYLPEDIVHFKRGRDPQNPRLGLGAFQSVLREIYGDNMAANFSAVVLKNWGVLPYVISPKKGNKDDGDVNPFDGLTEPESRAKALAIKQSFINATTGDSRGEPLVQTIAIDIQKMGFSPEELDISRLRNVPESRVAAVTNIPAAVLQFIIGLENGTSYASYDANLRQAYHMAIMPIMKIAMSTIKASLLPEFGSATGAKQDFQFDFSKVQALQEDRDKLYERGTKALAAGGISRNQFLTSIGKAPEAVDVIYVPSTSVPMTPEMLTRTARTPGSMPVPQRSLDNPGPGKMLDAGRFDRRPTRLLNAAKSVSYDGLTLWRDPTGVERVINLKAVQDAFDSGEKNLEKELSDLRRKLIDDAIAGIISLSPADYHTLVLEAPAGALGAFRDELQAIYDKGRELVLQELEAQGASPMGDIGEADEEAANALDDLAEISSSRIINDLQSRVIGIAATLAVSGLTGAALEAQLRDEVEAGSTGYVRVSAIEADHQALGMGRSDEGAAQAEAGVVGSIYYSSVLDSASCPACEDADGTTWATEAEVTIPTPNPSCDGASCCRCLLIYVFAGEA